MLRRLRRPVRRWREGVYSRMVGTALRSRRMMPRSVAARHDLLVTAGSTMGVVGFVAEGALGTIVGPIDDSVVFRRYLHRGEWDPATAECLGAFLVDGGTFVDIGANLGLATIPIAANPAVSCICYEPSPVHRKLLIANIAMNCPHDNVSIEGVALLDRRDVVAFELSPSNGGDNRIRATGAGDGDFGEGAWPTVEVTARPLDEMLGVLRRPVVVKIDTQGAEPLVLAGGERTIGDADVVLLEFWPYGMRRLGADPEAVLQFLGEHFLEAQVWANTGEIISEWCAVHVAADHLREWMAVGGGSADSHREVLARKAPRAT